MTRPTLLPLLPQYHHWNQMLQKDKFTNFNPSIGKPFQLIDYPGHLKLQKCLND